MCILTTIRVFHLNFTNIPESAEVKRSKAMSGDADV
jgi:hypothetical protein